MKGVAALLAAAALAGCGGGDESGASQPRSGSDVFADAGCARCHTLAAAAARGTVGPNLDKVIPHHLRGGDRRDVIAGVVEQVRDGGGGMPPFRGKLREREIRDVAEYVVASARG